MPFQLNEIVPWGRSFREYELMFGLGGQDLEGGVLDCGGEPASFTAEMSSRGHRAVAGGSHLCVLRRGIRSRFDAVAGSMISQVRATPDDWTWSYHRDPDKLLATRRAALEKFLGDYEKGLRESRYLAGELPRLPLNTASFGLASCSHLLFLYSDLLTKEFHVQAIRELCRFAREVRIFPLLTLDRQPTPHLAAVRSACKDQGCASEAVRVDYEFQRGGNQMLRIFRTPRGQSRED